MRRIGRSLALLLVAATSFAQIRVEPPIPRLSAAPAALIAPPLLSPPPLSAPVLAAGLAAPVPAAAAADGPSRPANDALSAVSKAAAPGDGSELSPRALNAFWDGLEIPARDDAGLRVPAADGFRPEAAGGRVRAESPAPWLALKSKKHAEALDAAVRLARSTRAGRRAFAAAEKALDGAALPVDVLDLGRNYGELDYIEGRLRLDRKLFLPGREAVLAGTLAHELVHVAQHARGLPSNALELELEAHLQDLELLAELGVKPPKNTFARQSYEALRRGPKAFIALIDMAVPGGLFLGNSSFNDIENQLEEELEAAQARRGARAAGLAKRIAADLDRLQTPEGRRLYKDFSRRVLALLKTRAAEAKG